MLGCTGGIRLLQDADYAKWAIQIMVKFRDGEELLPLNANRQSGGVRNQSPKQIQRIDCAILPTM